MPISLSSSLKVVALSLVLFPLLVVVPSGAVVMEPQRDTRAQSAEAVAKVAQAITVRLEGATQGSGVLVKNDGNRYTVLTAWHVVEGQRPGEELAIFTSDGRQHQLEHGSLRRLGDVDLAVLTFSSPMRYPVAQVGDTRRVAMGSPIYVAGFPLASSAVPTRLLRFLEGRVVGKATGGITHGYELLYSSGLLPTLPGMSGGPLLSGQGELVGIHGQSETDTELTSQEGIAVKTGTNQAVPITYYSQPSSSASGSAPSAVRPRGEAADGSSRSNDELDAIFVQCVSALEGSAEMRRCLPLLAAVVRRSPRYSGRSDLLKIRSDESLVGMVMGEFCAYVDRKSAYRVIPNPGNEFAFSGSIGVWPGNKLVRAYGGCHFYRSEFDGDKMEVDSSDRFGCVYKGSWREDGGRLIAYRKFSGCYYRKPGGDLYAGGLDEKAPVVEEVRPDESFVFAVAKASEPGPKLLYFSFADFLSGIH